MRAATSIALIALLAAPAFAAPITTEEPPVVEEPTTSTTSTTKSSGSGLGSAVISSAAGGAAGAVVSNLLNKIESLFRRDFDERATGSLTNIIQQAQTLSAADKATVKTALVNKIGTLQGKRDDSELEARAPLSATGLGGSLLSSAAGGAASGLVGNLLGEIESLFKRDDFELEARAPLSSTSLGGSLLSSAAGGAASGLVGNLLGEIESLFRRGVTDVHDEELYVKRDASSITSIITQAQNLSAADKATVKTALVNKISTLQGKRDDSSLEARSPLTAAKPSTSSSSSGLGSAIISSAAGGAASGLVGNLLNEIESFFKRDDSELEARAPLSSTSLGGSLLSSAAGGAASGLVGNLLGEIESLFKRGDDLVYSKRATGSLTNIIKQAQTLSAADKATVKTALINKVGTLQNKRDDAELEARAGLGGAIASSVAGGAASGLVGNLLGEIESLFKREDFELEARAPLSAGSLGGSLLSSAAGGAASGLVGNLLGEIESLFRRSVTDVHDEELYAKRDVSSISNIITQAKTLSAADKATVKAALVNKIGTLQTPAKRLSASGAAGTALGGLASVGANSIVSSLLSSIESLFRREEMEALMARREDNMMKLHGMQRRAPLSSTSLGGSLLSSAAGGAASGLVGNLLGEIESLFKREEFELEARAPLTAAKPSSSGLGSAIASSAAGGAASGLVGNLLSELESLFRRSDEFEINDLD